MKIGESIIINEQKAVSYTFNVSENDPNIGTLTVVFEGGNETYYDITFDEWENLRDKFV